MVLSFIKILLKEIPGAQLGTLITFLLFLIKTKIPKNHLN